MNLVKALFDLMNGKKLKLGTIISLLALVMQQLLNIPEGTAANLATQIVSGGGALLAAIGWIHQEIKAREEKKAVVKK